MEEVAGRQIRQHQTESFRRTMEKEELESKISFQEDTLGPDSWLPASASWHSAEPAINVRVLNAFWPWGFCYHGNNRLLFSGRWLIIRLRGEKSNSVPDYSCYCHLGFYYWKFRVFWELIPRKRQQVFCILRTDIQDKA